jgi:hypothetical protein
MYSQRIPAIHKTLKSTLLIKQTSRYRNNKFATKFLDLQNRFPYPQHKQKQALIN